MTNMPIEDSVSFMQRLATPVPTRSLSWPAYLDRRTAKAAYMAMNSVTLCRLLNSRSDR